MEAKAFREAAALKVQEGEALAKVAAIKKGDALEKEDAAEEVTASQAADDTADAKANLANKVKQAKSALEAAKAEPFDEKALQKVVKMKKEVSAAKAKVEEDEEVEKKEEDKKSGLDKEMERNENKYEDVHHSEGNGFDGHSQHGERKLSMEDKNMKSDPETREWSDKDIDYWANKKMKWRFDDPMNENNVMAKIFQIKDMEAQTIVKMNQINTQVGMDDQGVRAGLMAKGHTVIVDGELVKQNPEYHIEHVFQGQKGKDPYTDTKARDPEIDDIRIQTNEAIQDKQTSIRSAGEEEAAEAVHARRPVKSFADTTSGEGAPSSMAAGAVSLEDLKKDIKKNKATIGADEPADDEEPTVELGASRDTDNELANDDSIEQIAERTDDEAMTDDNDVAEALDAGDMDGIDA